MMEREELKRIIKEVLREFFIEEWEYWWREYREIGYPPPPIYLIPRKEVMFFKESVLKFSNTTERLELLVNKLASWAPQCSERERIEVIQKEMEEINRKINLIIDKCCEGEEDKRTF